MEGWIKIHRRLTEWEWYTDINTFKLFMHFLLKANHKENTHRGQLVKRGQLVTGRFKLSSETGLSERQVRTALDKLLATNEVTNETTNKNSLITIINYDLYQNSELERPATRPTNDQPDVHKQEVKNEKKKELKAFTPPSISEVKEYFKEKGYTEQSAIKAFDYYDVADWKDSKGNKVKNWKQKMQGVWFKEENKTKKTSSNNSILFMS